MLGRGLESLIPNRRPKEDGNFSGDSFDEFAVDQSSADVDMRNSQIGDERGGAPFINDDAPISSDSQQMYNQRPVIDSYPSESGVYGTGQQEAPFQKPEPTTPKSEDKAFSNNGPTMASGPVFQIDINQITFNPYQPRKEFDHGALQELASSIRELGILQPLVVTKIEKETEYGTRVEYQLIAGQRRLMASKMLGLRTVPVIVRKTKRDTEALELAVVENIQREDLNIIETARAYARLSDEFGFTQREIATRLGKSREAVSNALRLLGLPTIMQDAIAKGHITESHARILLQIDDGSHRQSVFEQILSERLSVRDTKRRATARRVAEQNNLVRGDVTQTSPEMIQLKHFEKTLSEFLGAPVKVDFSRNGGKIIIHFYSPEEAQGIISRIHPEDNY